VNDAVVDKTYAAGHASRLTSFRHQRTTRTCLGSGRALPASHTPIVSCTSNLRAVGTPVGEQVGVMRPGGSEDIEQAYQRRLRAGPHIQRRQGKPHCLDSDYRNSSRVQAAKSADGD